MPDDARGTPRQEPLLRVIPLGGVGTFGMNCTVFETGGGIVVVDAGMKIPQGNYPGFDLFFPDLTYLFDSAHRVKAVVLTHGHDDHIGALPFLLSRLDVPVYGTAFTLALVRERLANGAGSFYQGKGDLRQMLFGQALAIGDIKVEPVRVTHSIPDSAALIIRTPAGTVVHSGDFRLEAQPVNGRPADLGPIEAAGREGVRLLLCDSTNADRPGVTAPEMEVARSLRVLFRKAPGRVFVATFASHIDRIRMILDAAMDSDRRVVLEGRRMVRNCALASELGFLDAPPGILVPAEKTGAVDPRRLVFLTTGTQGEPFSALSRIARGEHSDIAVGEGDMVIFSSRMIPGNELAVARIIDSLFRMGADVYYQDPPVVHVSGHGAAEEIARMIRASSPTHYMPVHGDYRQLVASARLGEACGVPRENVHILEPGDVLEFGESGAALGSPVPAGRILVDGEMVADQASSLLKERRRMAREGIVVVVAAIPPAGETAPEPAVYNIGVGTGPSSEDLDVLAARAAAEVVSERSQSGGRDRLEEDIRIAVRSVYRRALGKKPMVIPVILED